MTKNQIQTYENKAVHCKFINRHGDTNEVFGKVMEINCDSFYIRLFGTYERCRVLFSLVIFIETIQLPDKLDDAA